MLLKKLDNHIKIGDPSDPNVNFGPLCNENGVKNLRE